MIHKKIQELKTKIHYLKYKILGKIAIRSILNKTYLITRKIEFRLRLFFINTCLGKKTN